MNDGPFGQARSRTIATKRLYEIQLGKMLQNDSVGLTDRLVPYFKAKHVHWEGVVSSDLPLMWASQSDLGKYDVRQGDLLVSEGGDVGRAAILLKAPKQSIIQNALHRVRSSTSDVRFLCYTLKVIHGSGWLDVLCNKATIAHLTGEKLGELSIPAFPLPTQQAIASFLDRKTAAIDDLIEKKERLIALLAEKRAALINRAVTEGLDPNVPMKDSGVPWVGKIPTHWEVKRLRNISGGITVGVVVNPSSYVDDNGEVPFIYGSEVSPGKIDVSTARRISHRSNKILAKSRLRAGDLVCVRVGDPGVTAVVPQELEGMNCGSVMIIRRAEAFDSHWLCHTMNSPAGRHNIWLVAYGAAQKQYNIGHAVDFVYPFPPRLEQEEIALHLSKAEEHFSNATTHILAQVLRLQEYRQALITAAVTGQIDVPEEVPA